MDLGFSFTKTEQFTKDNGKMIFSMAKEMKVGVMDLNILESINLEKKMEKVTMSGQTDRTSAVIGWIINIKVTEPITGQMVGNIKVNGKMEKCMESEYIKNQMENYIQVNSKMIKNKVMGFKNQNLAKYIKALGMMANSMAWEYFIKLEATNINTDCGKKGC